jgi:hypothetical protein
VQQPPPLGDNDRTERSERMPAEALHLSHQNPNQTLAGVGAVRVTNPQMMAAPMPPGAMPQITFAPSPATGSEPPQHAPPPSPARDDVSDVGARPLVEFKPHAARPSLPAQPQQAAGPATGGEEYRIRSTNGWLIFAILLVLGVAAAVAVIVVAG